MSAGTNPAAKPARPLRDDGTGWLGTCIWCRKPVRGSAGIYSAGVVYHRGECADAYHERHRAFFDGLKAERDAAVNPVSHEPAGPPTRPILRYHGSKWRLAPWVISHFPAHRVYVEPFMGGLNVLLRKPRSYAEVASDADESLVRFFRALQDRTARAELERRLRATPFARAEWKLAYEPTDDPVEHARRLIIRSHMGFGNSGCWEEYAGGFRANSNRTNTIPAHDWATLPGHLLAITERVQGVVLETRAAASVIAQQDSEGTLIYEDPPYPHDTRGGRHAYRHEMTDDDHRELAAVNRAARGYVIISGYPCDLYDRELYPDWHRVERPALADGGRKRTEVLWLNPRAWEALQRERQPVVVPTPSPASLGGLFAFGATP